MRARRKLKLLEQWLVEQIEGCEFYERMFHSRNEPQSARGVRTFADAYKRTLAVLKGERRFPQSKEERG